MQDTSRSVLDTFDVDVVKRLNMRREQTMTQLNDYQQILLYLAKAELPNAVFNQHRFRLDQQWFDVRWQEAEATEELIQQAKQRILSSVVVELNYSALAGGHYSDVKALLGQSGEMLVEKIRFSSKKQSIEHLLIAACTDQGTVLAVRTAERLLQVSGQVIAAYGTFQHEINLLAELEQQTANHYQQVEVDNARYYEEENDKLEQWAEDRKVALDIRIKQLDMEIQEARKAARQVPSLQEKIQAKRELKRLEQERDQEVLNYHTEKKRIEAEEDRLLDEAAEMLEFKMVRERLFTIRWLLKEDA